MREKSLLYVKPMFDGVKLYAFPNTLAHEYYPEQKQDSRAAEKICATLVAISTNHVIATP